MDGGFNFVFDWTANSKTVNEDTTFEFIPPVYSGCASSFLSWHRHLKSSLVAMEELHLLPSSFSCVCKRATESTGGCQPSG